ncbi:bifunctional phosphoglucose/phosphomannose isomerase [Candidatus Bathyarchaeota archaeon]|nr:bifunctional phosphoglucose/phosphomannose isomerase [Desulfobacterales bacterium]NIU80661.1 bifunctional phosphoglucose/phosphomannose isomerase [Candidatus Bathyarchaeota archaeon]NIW15847.1 bifunctional phosphoglucose/phosphomannose isomerase [Candidatus Bathyarchaeota archaeon]
MEKLKELDPSNMLGHCLRMPEYCREATQLGTQLELPQKVKISKTQRIEYGRPRDILIAGMGGSAIGGEMLGDWLREELSIPVGICRDYHLPAHADEDTLVFVVSYSGETEEALSAFVDVLHRRCMTITLTSGGHLLSFSDRLGVPHLRIPEGFPSRAAFPYLFFPLPILLHKLKLISDVAQALGRATKVLEGVKRECAPHIAVENNPSKRLALELKGTIPVIYSLEAYRAVAHRLKTQLNENSKLPCRYDTFPELNHNEIMGWEASQSLTHNFSALLLRDPEEAPETKYRIQLTKSLLSEKARKVHELHARGEDKLSKMLSLVYLGDFLSVYLALLRDVDPTPVQSITLVKNGLRKRFAVADRLEAEIQELANSDS